MSTRHLEDYLSISPETDQINVTPFKEFHNRFYLSHIPGHQVNHPECNLVGLYILREPSLEAGYDVLSRVYLNTESNSPYLLHRTEEHIPSSSTYLMDYLV